MLKYMKRMTYIEKITTTIINADKYADFMITADKKADYMFNTEKF